MYQIGLVTVSLLKLYHRDSDDSKNIDISFNDKMYSIGAWFYSGCTIHNLQNSYHGAKCDICTKQNRKLSYKLTAIVLSYKFIELYLISLYDQFNQFISWKILKELQTSWNLARPLFPDVNYVCRLHAATPNIR